MAWTIDFHVAQNDATVKGAGSHDKTGRHCLPGDPNGKMDVVRVASAWMRDENGHPTRAFQHVCWDGCMFPNAVMEKQQTWNDILATMISVRDAHGWREEDDEEEIGEELRAAPVIAEIETPRARKGAAKKTAPKAKATPITPHAQPMRLKTRLSNSAPIR